MQVHDSLSGLVGNTPLIRLRSVNRGIPGSTVLAKVEYFNPGGSVKDRIALRMVAAAEAAGDLEPGGTIVEPTSGNTGVGLAIVAAERGYRCIFICPDKVGQDKIAVLRAYGADVVVCPGTVAPDHPDSYYSVARRLAAETPGGWQPDQYANAENPASHYATTGPEIWSQTDGTVTHFVAGIGTGGTISGVGRYLKEVSGGTVRIIGADPEGSVYSGGSGRPYLVEGVGEDIWPVTYDQSVCDEIIAVSDAESFGMTRRLAREEALLAGGSSGLAVAAALRVAETAGPDAVIVVLLPDGGRGYLSKIFNDEWMRENGFLEDAPGLGTVSDLLAARESRPLVTAHPDAKLRDVVALMKSTSISQLPVVDSRGKLSGIVAEVDVLRALVSGGKTLDSAITEVAEDDYATVTPNTKVELLQGVLSDSKAAIVEDGDRVVAIVTRIDLIDFFTKQTAAATTPSIAPTAV
jgi:cystathionine beta-synthase